MKKILGIVLAVLFALSCILLVACNTAVTDLKFTDAPKQVKRGETVDYSKIHVEATLENGKTKTLALTDKGVTYDKISTAVANVTQTLTARYGGQTAEATIEVVEGEIDLSNAIINKFGQADGYSKYKEAIAISSTAQTGFYNKKAYTVGNVNGYLLLPDVSAIVDGEIIYLSHNQVHTTFKLYHKDSGWTLLTGTNLDKYLAKAENNIYYFTKDAEHETFKLEVTLGEEYAVQIPTMNKTIEQEFEVVNGYNAYDVLGLSVIDNCNIKSWAEKKDYTFDWDDGKKVSQFNTVEQVILHNNITIKAADLPDNYFWKKGQGGSVSYNDALSRSPEDLRPYLEGSLREVYLGEDWENGSNTQQRGLFVSSGIGLNGNFLKVDYVDNINKNGEKGLFIVHDFNQKSSDNIRSYPESHYSIICYREQGQLDGLNKVPVIENVYFSGETTKTEDITTPAGLMTVASDISEFNIRNTIASYWFSNLTLSGDESVNNIDSCKFYYSFSQMMYAKNLGEINITNCEMKVAGGPLLIVIETEDISTTLNIDSVSNMENWVTGSEVWFTINMKGSASVIPQLLKVATVTDGVVGTHFASSRTITGESGKDEQVTTANLIAVLIPDPGKVMDNQDAIPGTFNIGTGANKATYGMENSVFETIINLADIAKTGADLGTRTSNAFKAMQGDTTSLDQLQAGFAEMAAMPQLQALKLAPIYQCGNAYGMSTTGANFLSLVSGGVVSQNITQLYMGVLQAINTMKDIPQAAELLTEWEELKTALQPLGELSASIQPLGQEAWDAAKYAEYENQWKKTFTAGNMAVWVNPGGLDAEHPNPTLKHFMILLGEGTDVAD